MRAVIQRVSEASVSIGASVRNSIARGLLVLLAVEEPDGAEDIEWLSGKIVRLRIFDDESGVMNRSVQEVGGEILLVSQFTLFASTKKGNRRRGHESSPHQRRAGDHRHRFKKSGVIKCRRVELDSTFAKFRCDDGGSNPEIHCAFWHRCENVRALLT